MKSVNIFFFLLLSFTFSYSQNLQLDMTAGAQFTNISFHHNFPVDTDSDESFDNEGSYYVLGMTRTLSPKWRLRTEIGYTLTNSFMSLSYKYDVGLGEKNYIIVSYLSNQKIHLGILPEYRKTSKSSTYFLQGGILLSTDLSNNFTNTDRVLLPKSNPLIFKLNNGIILGSKKIKFKMEVGIMWTTKSQVINRYHPSISYRSINAGFGLVYEI